MTNTEQPRVSKARGALAKLAVKLYDKLEPYASTGKYAHLVWPIQARLSYLDHKLRGHKARWRHYPEPWIGCFGHICCDDCPDTADACGLIMWDRHWPALMPILQALCGLLGHGESRPSQQWFEVGQSGLYGEWRWINEWHCYRCMADMPTPPDAEARMAELGPPRQDQ